MKPGLPTDERSRTCRPFSLGHLLTHSMLAQSVVIVVVAIILCLPCLLVGIPPGYDSWTHVPYQYHFSRQFWSGDLYPRWLAGANKGYGSPIFLIQYPFPYFVAALLRPIMSLPPTPVREARELGVFCFLVVAAAGLAVRVWLRQRCTALAATVGSIVYISLPYVLGQSLYTRPGLGELCAFLWMPLALALCASAQSGFVVASALGIVFALLILSHILTAALFVPLMVGYAIAAARDRYTVRKSLAAVLAALVLGVGIAAVYVFPLAAYHKLIDISAMPASMPSFELARGFAFTASSGLLRGWVAVAMAATIGLTLIVLRYIWNADGGFVERAAMALTLVLGILMAIPGFGWSLVRLSGLRLSPLDTPTLSSYATHNLVSAMLMIALGVLAYCGISRAGVRGREQWLLIAACGSFLMALPWSAPVWRAIPQLAMLQFPSRLCTILTVAATGLFAVALDDSWRRGKGSDGRPSLLVISLAAFTVVAAGALAWGVPKKILRPGLAGTVHVDLTQEVDQMFRAYVSPEHIPAFAKILGTAPDSFDVASTPIEDGIRAEFTSGRGTVEAVGISPREVSVSVKASENARVRIGQLYSPLWKVVPAVGSADYLALGSSPEGLIQVSFGAGPHDFELVFDGGRAERWGAVVSLVSLLFAAGSLPIGLWEEMRKRRVAAQHARPAYEPEDD